MLKQSPWRRQTNLDLCQELICIFSKVLLYKSRFTTYCDICDHAYKNNYSRHLNWKRHWQNVWELHPKSNVIHCDVCDKDVEKGGCKSHLQTNKHTLNLFQMISSFKRETKYCSLYSKDMLKKNFNRYIQTRKHKRVEKKMNENGDSIESADGEFKGHIKISWFWFKEPTPTSII